MNDHLDITAGRRAEIQDTVGLLGPVEAGESPGLAVAFDNYLQTLTMSEPSLRDNMCVKTVGPKRRGTAPQIAGLKISRF